MPKEEKQRFYPICDADAPSKVSLIPITGEALYSKIWRIQKILRQLGR